MHSTIIENRIKQQMKETESPSLVELIFYSQEKDKFKKLKHVKCPSIIRAKWGKKQGQGVGG